MNMKIHHVAVYVQDLEISREYYEKYFGAESNELYHNKKTGLKTYFLSFDNGCKVEIMSRPGVLNRDNSVEQTGYLHLAFIAGDKNAVDLLTDRIRGDGFTVYSEPRVTGDGYYESNVADPDGNSVEIIMNPECKLPV